MLVQASCADIIGDKLIVETLSSQQKINNLESCSISLLKTNNIMQSTCFRYNHIIKLRLICEEGSRCLCSKKGKGLCAVEVCFPSIRLTSFKKP